MKNLCYVVNIKDPLNIDIDLSDNIESPLYEEYVYEENGVIKSGKVHRCRIRGIVLKNNKNNNEIFFRAYIEMMRIIDRSNGWIICEIFDIDKLDRVLVDLYDPLTNTKLNDLFLKYPYNEYFKLYKSF